MPRSSELRGSRPAPSRPATSPASRALEASVAGVRTVGRAATTAFEDVSHAVAAFSHPTTWVQLLGKLTEALTTTLGVDRNVRALSPRDSYTMSLAGNASAPGVKVLARGTLDVKRRPDGKFTLGLSGEAMAGMFEMFGFLADAQGTGGESFVSPDAGGRVEFSFKSANGTIRAIHLLQREALLGTLFAPALDLPLISPGFKRKLGGLSSRDEAFLHQSLSAVELKGGIFNELKVRMGLAKQTHWVSPFFTAANGRADNALRVELEQGKPIRLVLKETRTVEGSGTLSLMAGGDRMRAGSRAGEGVVARGTFVLEQRFDLPANASLAKLRKDPLGMVQKTLPYLRAHPSHTLTSTVQFARQGMTSGSGWQRSLELSAPGTAPRDALKLATQLLDGDGANAKAILAKKSPGARIELRREPFKQLGFAASPEVRVMGSGVGVDIQALRQHLGA